MRNMFLLAVALLLAAGLPAAAQDGADGERYELRERGDAIVRLDRRTGEVSTCTRGESGDLVCRLAADDRTALMDEIERLEAENRALSERLAEMEDRLAALEDTAPQDSQPEAEGDWTIRLPTEEEMDRVIDFLGESMRRMGEEMRELRRQWQEDTPPENEPAPEQQRG